MAQRLVRVRMRRAVESYVQVMDLEPGEVYSLTPAAAEQFIANEMAERVEAGEADELELAALRPGRRRG
jgi:hypothetical protein